MRVAWGLKWAELMAPDGLLVVFVFPIKPEKKDGRPWHVDESIATEMLSEGEPYHLKMLHVSNLT